LLRGGKDCYFRQRMPTPVGHALGGLAFGWLIAGAGPTAAAGVGGESAVGQVRRQLRHSWRRAVVFAVFGAFADIDLLFHAHSTYTHSVGAAMLAGLVAFVVALARDDGARGGGARVRAAAIIALACGAAYGSHVLLDWLGVDNSPPLGVTALWPFSSAWYYSGVDLFPAVDRRYWLPGFVMQDAKALAVELIVLVPFTALVLWLRGRKAQKGYA
jgi:hypothetical protein